MLTWPDTQPERPHKRKAMEDEAFERSGEADTASSRARDYPRKRVSIACEVCRMRKTRCDARRPACSLCMELEIECVYKRPGQREKSRADGGEDATLKRLDDIQSTLNSLVAAVGYRRPSAVGTGPVNVHPDRSPSKSGDSIFGRSRYMRKMPNLLTFKTTLPDSSAWNYDCTGYFFVDQMEVAADLCSALRTPIPALDLSKPRLWGLKRSFAENLLNWLPIFDHETASRHLISAQNSGHKHDTPSLCLVFLMYAIGSIASDGKVYCESSNGLPGFDYYSRASTISDTFPSPSKDLCVLQCCILTAVYFLFAMRPLEAWKWIFQASQNCCFLLKVGVDGESSQYLESFHRLYWICYVLENELEVCLEVPPSGLRAYESVVPLPTSHYEEDGMYYLLALSSLRKLMVEVVETVGLNSPLAVAYAPVVALELRNQIDDWYQHLPGSLRFPLDRSLLFDTRKGHLRCQYFALVAVVSWPFVLSCKNILSDANTYPNDEDSEHHAENANECLKVCRDYLQAAEEILTQKSLVSHLVVRGYFATAMILLLVYSERAVESQDDKSLLEQAFASLSYWEVVPFLRQPLHEMRRIAQLKGLAVVQPSEAAE